MFKIESGLKPGIIENLPEEVYHADHAMSATFICDAHESPAFFKLKHIDGKWEPTKAMKFGRLAHAALLEPDRFRQKNIVMPDFGDFRSSTNRAKRDAWLADLPKGAIPLDQEDAEKIAGMLSFLHTHHKVAMNMMEKGLRELTVAWIDPVTGLPCRGRIDFYNEAEGILIDYKTCDDVSPEAFLRTIRKLRYDLRMSHYKEGLIRNGKPVKEVLFVAQESKPPYHVNTFWLDETIMEEGAQRRQIGISRLTKAIESNIWPGYEDRVVPLFKPAYWNYQED